MLQALSFGIHYVYLVRLGYKLPAVCCAVWAATIPHTKRSEKHKTTTTIAQKHTRAQATDMWIQLKVFICFCVKHANLWHLLSHWLYKYFQFKLDLWRWKVQLKWRKLYITNFYTLHKMYKVLYICYYVCITHYRKSRRRIQEHGFILKSHLKLNMRCALVHIRLSVLNKNYPVIYIVRNCSQIALELFLIDPNCSFTGVNVLKTFLDSIHLKMHWNISRVLNLTVFYITFRSWMYGTVRRVYYNGSNPYYFPLMFLFLDYVLVWLCYGAFLSQGDSIVVNVQGYQREISRAGVSIKFFFESFVCIDDLK